MNWYLDVLKNRYAQFEGRARREEFWMFILVYILISIAVNVVDAILGTRILGAIYWLALLVPCIALSARRLHDTNRSGWWQLIGLIPIIGTIILIVWFATEGQSESNQYGMNPKA
ncbi:DUF805 domain-containing protein [Aquirhabdus parva]|uniref:DUF805 domain-containing protein n=1 Tax=Aquirhabdus parva TaxID=2283318 RepID=A0A345P5F5_9GAMM|nr:DUF805 domain-containing protein [Aquirhabdus parva]AXI02514.1 DUF805 domain-containing protein [Aquirhabdus parva]